MSQIQYYSTNLAADKISFGEALLKGLAPDGGLYMPDSIPQISPGELKSFSSRNYHEIAFEVLWKFLKGTIKDSELQDLVKEAYNFEVPLEKVYEKKYILRLDRGPTASFKDFAARMMGNLMQYFLQKANRKMLILTATSGDTGSAIANAFYGLENIKVVILFPEKEVTDRQRKQMTTLHKNVNVLALKAKFDDCQALVKEAFNDRDLDYLQLSSANSINIGRLLPQSVYYIYAYSQLCDILAGEQAIFTVPSGNFGNLMGGLLAMKMGLPVRKFVVATNENDEVPEYFRTGNYKTIVPSLNCISSAMNVGHPSNMARIVALYGGQMNSRGEVLVAPDMKSMKKDMFTVSISDEETLETIRKTYDSFKVLLEPHGSVGWAGLIKYFFHNPAEADASNTSVVLETAHPAKFPKEIRNILGIEPGLPESLKGLEEKEERFTQIDSGYHAFKKYLIENYSS